MKEFPHCPCIPGVSREMQQLFGFNSLKNLAFHIAAESVLSSLVQTAECEKSRQGKSTSCFIVRYSPLWGDWQDWNILTLLSCRVEPLSCNSVFVGYKIHPLCSRKRFCDLIKTLMLLMGWRECCRKTWLLLKQTWASSEEFLQCCLNWTCHCFYNEGRHHQDFWERSVGVRQINCVHWKEFLIEDSFSAYLLI